MESWQTVLVVIVALLAGAILPAIVQLWLTLRSLGRAAETVSAQTREALVALTSTAQRVDRLTERIERDHHVEHLLAGMEMLSRSVARLQDSVGVASALGAAVGPAVGAAVHAWRATRTDDGTSPEKAGDGAGVHDTEEGRGGVT